MSATLPEILDAFKFTLSSLAPQIYSFVPPTPNVPALVVYPETWPYDVTADMNFIIWCIGGTIEQQGAQEQLMSWLSDEGPDSIIAALDADNQLGGVISSVIPIEVRNWGISPVQEGRARYVQAELVCHVLR